MSIPETREKIVSIIIVTYNAANHLKACLESIVMQSYPALELVVIDGSSTDGTVEIIKSYSDPIHFWSSEPDKGIYDAMNKGLKHISGDWVYFLGADDFLLPSFSDMLFNELHNDRYIYYGHVLIENRKDKGKLSTYEFIKTGLCHQAIIYPSKVFRKYQFDLKYPILSDFHLNLLCWADNTFSFHFRDYVLANFNNTGISSTYMDKAFQRDESGIILKRFGFFIWFRYQFRKIRKKTFKS